jgi:hypothetical protein
MLLESMRGTDEQQSQMFSYLSPEQRVRKDHPLRAIRTMVDEVLRSLSREFDRMYSREGRPSIAPEKLLRALVVQMLYSIRSERLLMEEIEYNTFHGGRHATGSLGGSEKLSAEGEARESTGGRCEQSHGRFPWGAAVEPDA